MRRTGSALRSIGVGLLSAAIFLLVFGVTALPTLAIVEDDNALVTWAVLIACSVLGWAAARITHRRFIR